MIESTLLSKEKLVYRMRNEAKLSAKNAWGTYYQVYLIERNACGINVKVYEHESLASERTFFDTYLGQAG